MQATNNDHDRYLSHQRITLRPVVGLVGLLLFLDRGNGCLGIS